MDIIETAIRNAHIDAQARARALQTKARGKDPTRKARAKEANVRDAVDRPSAWRSTSTKQVRFALSDPAGGQTNTGGRPSGARGKGK